MMALQGFPWSVLEDLLLSDDASLESPSMELLTHTRAVTLAGNAFNGYQFVALVFAIMACCYFSKALHLLLHAFSSLCSC